MRVLILSHSTGQGGGSRVAYREFCALRSLGIEVELWVQHKDSNDEKIIALEPVRNRLGAWGPRIIHRMGLDFCDIQKKSPNDLLKAITQRFDIVHVHALPGMGIIDLPALSRSIPLVKTLHDMGSLTGNCIYPYACERWKTQCKQCPQFGEFPLHWLHRDSSFWVHRLRKWIYKRCAPSMHLIAVSDWLKSKVAASHLSRFPVTAIQNAVDTDAYYPVVKKKARERLGIPLQAKVVAFAVASNPLDTRKGTDLILAAISRLKKEHLYFLPSCIGKGAERLESLFDQHSIPHRKPQHFSTDEELRNFYNGADVLWHPSRADTSSLVSMEAMACGTPVIAAAVGGVPEVVGDAGILIEPNNSEALVSATRGFFQEGAETRVNRREQCRSRALERFGMERFGREHLDCFKSIIEK